MSAHIRIFAIVDGQGAALHIPLDRLDWHPLRTDTFIAEGSRMTELLQLTVSSDGWSYAIQPPEPHRGFWNRLKGFVMRTAT